VCVCVCVWSRNIKNRCSIYIYIYIFIYDISSIRFKSILMPRTKSFCYCEGLRSLRKCSEWWNIAEYITFWITVFQKSRTNEGLMCLILLPCLHVSTNIVRLAIVTLYLCCWHRQTWLQNFKVLNSFHKLYFASLDVSNDTSIHFFRQWPTWCTNF